MSFLSSDKCNVRRVRLTKKFSYSKRFLQPIIQCACKLFHLKYTDQINQDLIQKYNKKKTIWYLTVS